MIRIGRYSFLSTSHTSADSMIRIGADRQLRVLLLGSLLLQRLRLFHILLVGPYATSEYPSRTIRCVSTMPSFFLQDHTPCQYNIIPGGPHAVPKHPSRTIRCVSTLLSQTDRKHKLRTVCTRACSFAFDSGLCILYLAGLFQRSTIVATSHLVPGPTLWYNFARSSVPYAAA